MTQELGYMQEEAMRREILKSVTPRFFSSIGLTDAQVRIIIGKLRYYINTKAIKTNNREAILQLVKWVANDTQIEWRKVLKVYMSIVANVLKSSSASKVSQALKNWFSTAPNTSEVIKERISKTISFVPETIIKAGKKVSDLLPWYAKPGTIILAGLIIGGVYVTTQTGILKKVTGKQ